MTDEILEAAAISKSNEPGKFAFLKDANWFRNVIYVFALVGLLIYNYPTLDANLLVWMQGMSGMRAQTLFATTFILAAVMFLLIFAMIFLTGGLSYKLALAKVMRYKMTFHRSEDGGYDFAIVRGEEHGIWNTCNGGFNRIRAACGRLKNGTVIMPTMDHFAEGVNFDDLKDKIDVRVEPKPFMDLLRQVRVDEREKIKQGILAPQNLMVFTAIIMVIGIAGYLLMGQMQSGECQGKLEQMYVKCAQAPVDALSDASTTTTIPGKKSISKQINEMI
jgi:hypothetical protein